MERLKLFCIVLLMLGLLFRGINVDRKVYWHDEAYTSLEITAHTRSELVSELFTGQIVGVDELQRYQRLDPERGLAAVVVALGREDPQHPPLYYVLGHLWKSLWGNADPVNVTRSLSVILSLLVFPAAYWLCLELFESRPTAWVAIALLAISPLHVLYAQEAREYSFWTALVLFSGAAFLRAMRQSNWRTWGLYAVTLVLSFYTALFSGLVALANAVYVLLNNRSYSLSVAGFRLERRAIAYGVISSLAVLAFIPWIYFLVVSSEVVKASTNWITVSLPFVLVLKMWFINLTRVFVDVDLNPFDTHNPIVYLVLTPVLLLELYSLYFLCRTTPKRVWTFVLTLVIVPILAMALPDLISGGQRSTVTRYLLPCFLGLELSVAHLLATQLLSRSIPRRFVGRFLAIAVVLVGLVSCVISSQADTWWNKVVSYNHPQIARVLNERDRPLLITDAYGINPVNAVALSYLVNDSVKFLLLPEVSVVPEVPNIPSNFESVFLLNLPDFYRDQFAQELNTTLVPVVETELWQQQ
jgi:uncharacterized membrane protein